MRTRRLNKMENKKTKQMCEALDYAEKHQKPDLEGELPDMPVLQKDDDWSGKSKRKNSKNFKKDDSL